MNSDFDWSALEAIGTLASSIIALLLALGSFISSIMQKPKLLICEERKKMEWSPYYTLNIFNKGGSSADDVTLRVEEIKPLGLNEDEFELWEIAHHDFRPFTALWMWPFSSQFFPEKKTSIPPKGYNSLIFTNAEMGDIYVNSGYADSGTSLNAYFTNVSKLLLRVCCYAEDTSPTTAYFIIEKGNNNEFCVTLKHRYIIRRSFGAFISSIFVDKKRYKVILADVLNAYTDAEIEKNKWLKFHVIFLRIMAGYPAKDLRKRVGEFRAIGIAKYMDI